jgi:protein-S-isoprenylcysteine O-methyltransferase Ste14
MKRVKLILVAAAVGAVVGALIVRPDVSRIVAGLPFLARDPVLRAHINFFRAAAAGWVIFSLYWEYAARNAAPAKSAESKGSRAFHVTMTNAAALLVIAPIRGAGRALPASMAVMSAGLAIEGAGVLLAIWSRTHLGRYWSGEISVKVDHELIRTGPYGRLRHPIYTGVLAMYVGCALVTGEWLAMIGVAIALFAYWRKIRLEEANLHNAFGANYDAYRQTTWALVPGIF